MTYLKVKWLHRLAGEPVLLFSELSDSRKELRKVEVYRDGRYDYADELVTTGGAVLSETPIPTMDEIGADPQFDPVEIDREEFERAWAEAMRQHLKHPSR